MDAKAAAAFFARVSRDLMEETSEVPTMQRIAERAVQVVPGCDHCSISVRRRRHRVEFVASTSTLAEKCDALQYELDQGPCLEAVWEDDSYLIEDTAVETRWPLWSPRVAEQGIGSVLCIRLATSTETLGAMNLYAEPANGFSTDDIDLAAIYALHATNAMNTALLVKGLQTAVESRHLIGVAQGILMQNYGIDMEQAFEVLRRYSSHKNIKLREVAEHVVRAGDLPDRAALPG
jgi:GAF domain-containing protein